VNTLARTLAALALHQTARLLERLAQGIKPAGIYVPEDAPVTLVTSPWFYRPNVLVIEDQEDPVFAYPYHVVTLLGVTVATTLDNSGHGSDDSRVYVLLNSQRDPWALYGRDEEGYLLDEDLREVV